MSKQEITNLRVKKLVSYFEKSDDLARKAEELPFLLSILDDKKALYDCLTQWEVFDYWYNEIDKYDLLQFWRKTEITPDFTEMIDSFEEPEPLKLGYRFYRIGEFLLLYGSYNDACKIVERSVGILQTISGGLTSEYAYSINCLAKIYDTLYMDKALEYYQKALHVRRRVFGNKHILVSNSINNVAVYLQLHKRPFDALPLFKEALEMCKVILGEVHSEVADLLNNMGQCYQTEKQFEEAEKIYLESINIRKLTQGEYHPKIAFSYSNLGNLYKDMRSVSMTNISKAKSYYELAHNLNSKIYGPDHMNVAQDYENLASLNYIDGKLEECLKCYKECARIRREHVPTSQEYTRVLESIKFIEEKLEESTKKFENYSRFHNPSISHTVIEEHVTRSYGASIVHRKCF